MAPDGSFTITVPDCLAGCCSGYISLEECKVCGFNRFEDARRKKLPMVKGKDGKWRKHVGSREARMRMHKGGR